VQKLVDLKAMAYRFLVVPVAGVLGLGGYGEEGKRERRRGTRFGAHPLQRCHGGRILSGTEKTAHCVTASSWNRCCWASRGCAQGEKVILGIPKQGASLWVVYIFVWSCH